MGKKLKKPHAEVYFTLEDQSDEGETLTIRRTQSERRPPVRGYSDAGQRLLTRESDIVRRQNNQKYPFKILRALTARLVFALHSLASVWCLTYIRKESMFWIFTSIPVLLFLEAMVTIVQRRGQEYKRFCPSIFIFLCGSVPSIWFMEIHFTTHCVYNTSKCIIYRPTDDNTFEISDTPESHTKMVQAIEQTLLIILVVGRWILPKGSISRDELSQLLLAYLAISSDIIELFSLFKSSSVRTSSNLTVIVLIIWSVSLIQFPLVITTAKGQKARHCWESATCTVPGQSAKGLIARAADYAAMNASGGAPGILIDSADDAPEKKRKYPKLHRYKYFMGVKLRDLSIWGIVSTIIFQDGPFLAIRLYIIIEKKMFNYSLLFFISKNFLIIAVQIYRMCVICVAPVAPEAGSEPGNLTEVTYSAANSSDVGLPSPERDRNARELGKELMRKNRAENIRRRPASEFYPAYSRAKRGSETSQTSRRSAPIVSMSGRMGPLGEGSMDDLSFL